MDTLQFKPGLGFNGTIENEDGGVVATINAWGTQQQLRYGRLFAAAPDLFEACERALDELDRRDGPLSGPGDIRPFLRSVIKSTLEPSK